MFLCLFFASIAATSGDLYNKPSTPVIGISLGTTFSSVGVVNRNGGTPIIVANEFGNRLTPSVVGVGLDGALVAGEAALLLDVVVETSCDCWVAGLTRKKCNTTWHSYRIRL